VPRAQPPPAAERASPAGAYGRSRGSGGLLEFWKASVRDSGGLRGPRGRFGLFPGPGAAVRGRATAIICFPARIFSNGELGQAPACSHSARAASRAAAAITTIAADSRITAARRPSPQAGARAARRCRCSTPSRSCRPTARCALLGAGARMPASPAAQPPFLRPAPPRAAPSTDPWPAAPGPAPTPRPCPLLHQPQTMRREDETCDPEEQICRTPAHTYESPCACCSGTGWTRTAAAASAFRGHGHGGHGRGHAGGARLGICIACFGIGERAPAHPQCPGVHHGPPLPQALDPSSEAAPATTKLHHARRANPNRAPRPAPPPLPCPHPSRLRAPHHGPVCPRRADPLDPRARRARARPQADLPAPRTRRARHCTGARAGG
jgi:hypothetical protein